MRAVVFERFGDEDVLEVREVPCPLPGPDEVRIRVAGATVNRTDLNARAGLYDYLEAPTSSGHALGMDVSGVVDATGSAVRGVAIGDPVVGFSADPYGHGAQAEFVTLPSAAVTRAPNGVDLARAATLPLNGLTALQAFASLSVGSGPVLVTGAAGGLGQSCVQVGRDLGFEVTGWVRSEADRELVTSLGAKRVVTSSDDLEPHSFVACIDAAVLTQPTIDLIADEGTLVTFRVVDPVLERGIRHVFVQVHADHAQLRQIAVGVESGRLVMPDVELVPLDDVAAAHRRFAAGGVRDRLVLVP